MWKFWGEKEEKENRDFGIFILGKYVELILNSFTYPSTVCRTQNTKITQN